MRYHDISNISIIAGNSHPELAKSISSHLIIPLLNTEITKFSDGEIRVELLRSVRGTDVYIIQPTCAPTNDNIMELLLIIDAARRAGCDSVTAIIPYYGYARQDRRADSSRTPISSKVVANLLESTGVDAVMLIDIHSTQQVGFFSTPVINVSAAGIITADIRSTYQGNPYIIVSPDVGGVARARALSKSLDDCELAIIDKRRPEANVAEVMNVIGDVAGKHCILIDDMVDTAGTLCKGADALMEKGALSVRAYCTHAILSGSAIENINNCTALTELVVTDTIPLPAGLNNLKIRTLTVSNLIAETIYRLTTKQSISEIQE